MEKLFFRLHALQRMIEREISPVRIRQALEKGEVLEDYSSEMPEPGRLVMGRQHGQPFHVVTSEKPEAGAVTVITVYLPDPDKWKQDGRSRRG